METQLGKYQLIRRLAVGGMAEVHLAKAAGPMGFEKTLVVKRILPHLAEDPRFVEMFLNEAKLAAQLEHPNIVQVFDFGEVEGDYYLAMELIDGASVRELARRAFTRGVLLPLAMSVKIVSLVCEGLSYAHGFSGLVHRDVSPDNVLVSRTGAVKVVDFGIAKAIGQENLTQAGTIKGKVSYMPPEQVRGQPLDLRADIYALGVVLYELLTGTKPFTAQSELGLLEATLHQAPTPLRARRAEVPEELERITLRAMAKNRDDRYQSCRELHADLERYAAGAGTSVGSFELAHLVEDLAPRDGAAVRPPAAPNVTALTAPDLSRVTTPSRRGLPPRKARWLPAAVGAAVSVGVAGLAVGALWPRSPRPPPPPPPPVAVAPVAAPVVVPDPIPEPLALPVPTKEEPAPKATAHRPKPEPRLPSKPKLVRVDVRILSAPGAVVYVDDRARGEAPVPVFELPEGKHRFRLVGKDEGQGRSTEVDIRGEPNGAPQVVKVGF